MFDSILILRDLVNRLTAKLFPSVLVVGAGSPNADWVTRVLSENGIRTDWTDRIKWPNPRLIRRFDVVYGIYLQSCSRYIVVAKLLGRKTVLHFVGSDAYWFGSERSLLRRTYWRIVLRLTDVVLYVSPHLESFTGRAGIVVAFPIAVEEFSKIGEEKKSPERDVLYYCPSGSANERIYRLDWIIDYAQKHPDEKITVLGNSAHPATHEISLPNVEVIPYVDYAQMPTLYKRHKRLIRMTIEDGLPRMIHEALLAGLQVTYNEKEIAEIPEERRPAVFASTIDAILEKLCNR